MQSRKPVDKSFWILSLALFLITAAILLPVSPVFRTIPGVDFSVFLYVGRKILEGGMPYRDAWDHKQPLIYLACALGQWLTPGSLWGTWWILSLSIGAGAIVLFLFLRRLHGQLLAFLSVSAGLLALSPVLWGGAIEEFAFAAQALVILCLGQIVAGRYERQTTLYSAGLGFFTGIGFLFKQNLISAGAAALVYLIGSLIITRRAAAWKILPVVFGGFILAVLPTLLYLASGGVLLDYWNAAFTFNSRYAGLGLIERFRASLDALEFMSTLPGLWVALTLWIASGGIVFLQACPWLVRILRHQHLLRAGLVLGLALIGLSLGVEPFVGQPGLGLLQVFGLGVGLLLAGISLLLLASPLKAWVGSWLEKAPRIPDPPMQLNVPLFALFYFPAILFMLTLSGRNYVYYFIPFIPFLIISFGAVGFPLLQSAPGPSRRLVWVVVVAVWLSMAYLPLLQLQSVYAGEKNEPFPEIVVYINNHTQPEETILAWGKPSPYVYILADRSAPTRYFYQAPVDEAGFNADFNISSMILADIQANPPRLFLYEDEIALPDPGAGCPLSISSEPNTREAIFGFVCERYEYTGKISNFLVFTLK